MHTTSIITIMQKLSKNEYTQHCKHTEIKLNQIQRRKIDEWDWRKTDLEPERRVEAMKNLGDLRLAIWGRAKEGSFGDCKERGFSFKAIVLFTLLLHCFAQKAQMREKICQLLRWYCRRRAENHLKA